MFLIFYIVIDSTLLIYKFFRYLKVVVSADIMGDVVAVGCHVDSLQINLLGKPESNKQNSHTT